jgi:hypothetical protein
VRITNPSQQCLRVGNWTPIHRSVHSMMSQHNVLLSHVTWKSKVIFHRGTLQNVFSSKIIRHWAHSNRKLPPSAPLRPPPPPIPLYLNNT